MKFSFPWIGLGIGLFLAIVLLMSGATGPGPEYRLPLLLLLFMSEFGLIVSVVGAFLGIRTLRTQGMQLSLLGTVVGCCMLAIGFIWLGLNLWPDDFSHSNGPT